MIVYFKLVVCLLFFMIKVQFTIGLLHFPGDLFNGNRTRELVEDGIKGFVEKILTFDDHNNQQKSQNIQTSQKTQKSDKPSKNRHHFNKEIKIEIKEDRADLDQIFGEKALPLLVEKLKIGEPKLEEALLIKLLLDKGLALKGVADGAIGVGELATLLGKGGELVGDTVAAKEAAEVASGVELAKLLPLLLAKEKAVAAGEAKLLGDAEFAKLLSLFATKGKAVEVGAGIELAKSLSTDLAKEKAVEVGAGIAGLELAKLIPLILGKEAIVEKSLFDAGTWATLKGLKAAEVSKVLPAVLGAEKLKLLGFENGVIQLDDAVWDIIKGLEVSEASKLLPLLLTKGKIAADTIPPLLLSKKALVTDSAIKIGEAEFAKLIALLVGKEKIEHLHKKEFFDIDENIWRILRDLTKTELVSILPLVLGKETLELLGFAHGVIDIEDHIWDSIKVLEAAELGKLLPLLIAKKFAHYDFGHLHPKLLHPEIFLPVEEDFDKFDLLKYHALNVPTDYLW